MKIITVWSGKGGTGKSCMAKNLAGYLSILKKKKVLLIDKDSQRSIYKYFSKRDDSPFHVTDHIPDSFDSYDYVICDMPPLTENTENPLSIPQLKIIENSDLIVCPFQPDETTLDSVVSIYSANTDATIKPVLNRFRSVSKLHKESLAKINNSLSLKDRPAAYEVLGGAQVLFDKMKYSKALKEARSEFEVLAKQLLKVVGK